MKYERWKSSCLQFLDVFLCIFHVKKVYLEFALVSIFRQWEIKALESFPVKNYNALNFKRSKITMELT